MTPPYTKRTLEQSRGQWAQIHVGVADIAYLSSIYEAYAPSPPDFS